MNIKKFLLLPIIPISSVFVIASCSNTVEQTQVNMNFNINNFLNLITYDNITTDSGALDKEFSKRVYSQEKIVELYKNFNNEMGWNNYFGIGSDSENKKFFSLDKKINTNLNIKEEEKPLVASSEIIIDDLSKDKLIFNCNDTLVDIEIKVYFNENIDFETLQTQVVKYYPFLSVESNNIRSISFFINDLRIAAPNLNEKEQIQNLFVKANVSNQIDLRKNTYSSEIENATKFKKIEYYTKPTKANWEITNFTNSDDADHTLSKVGKLEGTIQLNITYDVWSPKSGSYKTITNNFKIKINDGLNDDPDNNIYAIETYDFFKKGNQ